MGVKAFLFTEAECNPCESARKLFKKYIENGDVSELDIMEGLKRFNLGEPGGVPFIGLISDQTGECITKIFIGPEDGESEPETR